MPDIAPNSTSIGFPSTVTTTCVPAMAYFTVITEKAGTPIVYVHDGLPVLSFRNPNTNVKILLSIAVSYRAAYAPATMPRMVPITVPHVAIVSFLSARFVSTSRRSVSVAAIRR